MHIGLLRYRTLNYVKYPTYLESIIFIFNFPLMLPFINTEQTLHYRADSDLLNSSLKVLVEFRLI